MQFFMNIPFRTTNRANKESYMLFKVVIQDTRGALGRVLQVIYKGNFDLRSIEIAQTGIKGVGMVSLGVFMHGKLANSTMRKLEKIIEVFEVSFRELLEDDHRMAAYYILNKSILKRGLNGFLNRYGGKVIQIGADCLLVEQVAYRPAINGLYNEVYGNDLVSFCATPLNTDIRFSMEASLPMHNQLVDK